MSSERPERPQKTPKAGVSPDSVEIISKISKRGARGSVSGADEYEFSSSDSLATPPTQQLENALAQQFEVEVGRKMPTEPEAAVLREKKKFVDAKLVNITNDVKNRLRYKDGKPRSKFSDIRHAPVMSILDSAVARESPFWGFYTPFWIAIAVIMVNVIVRVVRKDGLRVAIVNSRIVQILMKDLLWVAMSDLTIYLVMYGSYVVQKMCKARLITWEKSGFWIQTVYEILFFVLVLWWLELKQYEWIGKVFLVLHSIVMLMKVHSYGFYNGYLWSIVDELEFSTAMLEQPVPEKVKDALEKSVSFCKFELERSSSDPRTRFPNNITAKNFFWFTMFPCVVYEIEYPRTNAIDWKYFSRKVMGIFGIIGVMIAVAQESVYPLAVKALHLRSLPFLEKLQEYPFVLLDMLPPFFLLYILVFFLIWDQILNAIAELTMFADRDFYGAWWNCTNWDEFSRRWNSPVHRFLLRHVYHSSISALQLSKTSATLVTFLLSSVFHEVVMYVIFGRLRLYLFAIQMYQLPLIAVSRTKYMRDQKVLGNIVFWIGIASGAALVSSLYLVF